MIYLFAAIFCSAVIPVIFRFAQIKNLRQAPLLTFNYIVCVLIAAGSFLLSDVPLTGIDSDGMKSLWLSIAIGIICGAFYYIGFYFYQKAVRVSGAAMSSAFGKMGVVIPIALTAVLWREYPTLWAVIGIAIALIAVFISFFDFKTFDMKKLHPVLIIFFLIGGLGDFTNKVFERYCLSSHEFIFLFFIFVTALIMSLKATVKVGRPDKKEILLGFSLGVPNMLTSFFLIRSLFSLPVYIVFPMFSGGTIVFALLLSLILFKDKPSRRQLVSIAMIAGALILLNI